MPKSLGAVAIFILAVASLTGCSNSEGKGGSKQAHKKPALQVHVLQVKPHSVDVYSKFPGRTKAYREATVIARVSGILKSRHYTEGHLVHEGQLLYQINPVAYQATVDQDKARIASDKATLAKDRRAWHRIHHLYKAHVVSQTKRDTSLSNLQTAQARLKQDKARLESAKITLGYTHVTAPLTGITSLRQTDVGSLVNNGTALTTITQLNPVYVRFALPENDALARAKAMHERGKKSTRATTRQVTIILPNGKKFPHKGRVDFTQSTINPQTGTVNMRAVVKNPNNQLMPGLYVRVRLRIETLPKAIVVPDKAIFTGQARSYVFVANNGKAKKQFVTLGPSVANGQVISKGLSAGDRVVVSGLGQIKPGARIKIVNKGKNKNSKHQAKAGETPAKTARIETRDSLGGYHLGTGATLTHRNAGNKRSS